MKLAPASALLVIALAACSGGHEVIMRSHSIAHRIEKVFVRKGGAIVLNGKVVDATFLAAELAKLKAAGGSVWYAREDGTADPTDAQMLVFKSIAAAGLPIGLFTDATFTKRAGP